MKSATLSEESYRRLSAVMRGRFHHKRLPPFWRVIGEMGSCGIAMEKLGIMNGAQVFTVIIEAEEHDGVDWWHLSVQGLVFHGLRHTWATRLVDCDARSDVVEFMGWGRRQSSTFRKHYLDFPNARLVEEIDKLTWPTATDEQPAQIRHSEEKRGAR